MTTFRLISLPVHAALELAGGIALLVVPFVFGFSAGGMVVAVALGALVIGLALQAATRETGGIPVAGHLAFDRLLALVAVIASIGLALVDDRAAATALAVGALAHLALTVTTRYTAST